jgi:tRNA pseudouridine55 synthase
VNGIILVDKETGWTSQDVVSYLRNKWKWGKTGHAGALDPGATGLLIILIGKATKQFELFQKLKKEYVAKIEFGKNTDSDDRDGNIISEYKGEIILDKEKAELILRKTEGEKRQVPPLISSVKINGVPAHRLVRKGKTVDLKSRKVRIYEADLLETGEKSVTARFVVSSGTYIRSIAREMGAETGWGAYLYELKRTKIGDWRADEAKKIKEITPEDLLTI